MRFSIRLARVLVGALGLLGVLATTAWPQGGASSGLSLPAERTPPRDPAPTPPPAPPAQPSARQEYFGAIALAFWTDRNGTKRAATGVVWNYASQAEADQKALERCRNEGGQGCSVRARFSNGNCGYVSLARDGSGNCAGWAGTKEEAIKQCRARGCQCKPAIGNCTARPN